MPDEELLHVMQASLQFSDPKAVIERDLHTIYSRGADVIGHTEASDLGMLLHVVAKQYGYQLVQPRNVNGKRVSTPIAVRNGITILSAAHLHVIDGQPGRASEGAHEPRGVTTVELDWSDEDVFVSEFHMLTGWGQRARAPERDDDIERQWRVTTSTVARMARGYRLSVLMGDTNYDPDDASSNEPSEILDELGFESVFDEAGRPDVPTHGRRTIDQLYTLKRDRRVSVERVRVWPDQTSIDHQQVSAWLRVSPR